MLKTLVMLCAIIFGSSSAFAQTESTVPSVPPLSAAEALSLRLWQAYADCLAHPTAVQSAIANVGEQENVPYVTVGCSGAYSAALFNVLAQVEREARNDVVFRQDLREWNQEMLETCGVIEGMGCFAPELIFGEGSTCTPQECQIRVNISKALGDSLKRGLSIDKAQKSKQEGK